MTLINVIWLRKYDSTQNYGLDDKYNYLKTNQYKDKVCRRLKF
jgi:hypothetical protein